MKIAVVGITGLVGREVVKVLEEHNFKEYELIPVASAKSVGKMIQFFNQKLSVISIEQALARRPDIAIFVAGSNISLTYAPIFAENGCVVIDNSSAWRSYEHIPLVVPEINASVIQPNDKIISNPNCSTIQMVMVLAPLHKVYKIKRLVIATYQSVTGTGVKAVEQLEAEKLGQPAEMVYPHPIFNNLFPHGGSFEVNGDTTEETKLLNETRKILQDNSINITSTVVRVPVTGGHSEAINVEFHNEYTLSDIYQLLENMPGVTIVDNPQRNEYPMPLYVKGKDEVFVGRIRRDNSQLKTLNLWVVADNLRKGAATNAVQIVEHIVKMKKN